MMPNATNGSPTSDGGARRMSGAPVSKTMETTDMGASRSRGKDMKSRCRTRVYGVGTASREGG